LRRRDRLPAPRGRADAAFPDRADTITGIRAPRYTVTGIRVDTLMGIDAAA
jgi:hypothetical protein